jgi:nucleoside-diphosphate-sugar epimerase
LSRFIFGMPCLLRLDGYDTPLQFVHEQDVAAGITAILHADGRGAYNLAPSDWSTISEIAQATQRRVFNAPFWLAYAVHWLAWASRLPFHESPAGFLYFVRYPWVVAPHRIVRELGFQFQFSSRDTLHEIIQRARQSRTSARPGGST